MAPSSPPYPADLYAALHRGTPGDLDFYQRACSGTDRVLELGCGHGRVLAALADVGISGIGLDNHQGLLQTARDAGHLAREGDMRDFDLGVTFERVLIPHNGVYCLLSEEALVACLSCAARHLEPGGLLVFDGWTADHFHAEAEPDDSDDELGLVAEIEVGGVDYEVFEKSRWVRATQRIDATYVHRPKGGGESIEAVIEQRYLLTRELPGLLRAAGLELVVLHGDFDQSVFDDESELWIATAVKTD